jgi:DNA-binding MarR family transcriptional regulator
MDHYDTFNGVLSNLFQEIMAIEGRTLITEEFEDITNNDMHIIEAVGIEEPRNMSTVAGKMMITVGTLTTAVNSLVNKGYIERVRSQKDRRIVLLSLTEKGRRAYDHHRKFHEEMIRAVMKNISEEEANVLVKALQNITDFFSNCK